MKGTGCGMRQTRNGSISLRELVPGMVFFMAGCYIEVLPEATLLTNPVIPQGIPGLPLSSAVLGQVLKAVSSEDSCKRLGW